MSSDYSIYFRDREKNLEKLHFGDRGADGQYTCMRDEYKWSSHRPDVLDSRLPAKDNTVYHGLEEDAKKFAGEAEKYGSSFHYQMAADYYNMAGDRRAETMKANPTLGDTGHADAVDWCYDRARELERKAEDYAEEGDWDPNSIFSSYNPQSAGAASSASGIDYGSGSQSHFLKGYEPSQASMDYLSSSFATGPSNDYPSTSYQGSTKYDFSNDDDEPYSSYGGGYDHSSSSSSYMPALGETSGSKAGRVVSLDDFLSGNI